MLVLVVAMVSSFATPAAAQVCSIVCNLTGSVNDYWPGAANAASGATSITLDARRAGAGTAGNSIAAGDWVIVMQMQDAAFNSTNSTSYGSGAGGGDGSGYTAARRTGLYEFVRVTGSVGAGGGVLNLASGLINAYNVTTLGNQTTPRFQVIRIPHCATVNLSGTISGASWNGSTGGVIAFRGETVNMGGATINADGLGFRGGATDAHNGPAGTGNYRNTDVRDQYKGEGITGTPDYIYDTDTGTEIATGLTFPAGYRARGAPGNAGGGGAGDSGGGGGGNAAAGGRGGVWRSGTTGNGAGGRGGAVFAEGAFNRAVLGGGGAGGSAGPDGGTSGGVEASPPYGTGGNAFSRGGAGGGIVILGAVTRAGSLTINARGADAPYSPGTTAAIQVGGGGGAGGSIVLYGAGGSIAVNAQGGNGADAQRTVHRAHGGGGGGGAVFASAALSGVTTALTGGLAGCTVAGANDSSATNCGTHQNSSTAGGPGVAAIFAASSGPGAPDCVPVNIAVKKDNGLTSVLAGQTTTYVLTVTNGGPNGASNSVLTDPAVAGLNCTAVTCTGAVGATCPAAGNVTIPILQSTGIILPSLPATSTLTFQVTCGVTASGQ